jgi:hypothetical protein
MTGSTMKTTWYSDADAVSYFKQNAAKEAM